MDKDLDLAKKHWDEFAAKLAGRRTGLFWWEVPEVMREINRRISGDGEVGWIEYTARKHVRDLPVERCLSLGCGTGDSERVLARMGAFRECDAFDLSAVAIEKAKEAARLEGFSNINYSEADINSIRLAKNAYDAIWLYGAMHHFKNLEHIATQIQSALKPNGIVALNEYVGPARFQFPERQKEIVNLCLQLFPTRYKRMSAEVLQLESERVARTGQDRGFLSKIAKLKSKLHSSSGAPVDVVGQSAAPSEVIKNTAGFPARSEVVADDPSESVRSDEILEIIVRYFDVVEKKEWGGNICQFLLAGIADNFTDEDSCSQLLIRMIWKIEDTLLACGELKSDFAYVVARRRR